VYLPIQVKGTGLFLESEIPGFKPKSSGSGVIYNYHDKFHSVDAIQTEAKGRIW